MSAVEYWEEILDQLKKIITYEEIEDYISANPMLKNHIFFQIILDKFNKRVII